MTTKLQDCEEEMCLKIKPRATTNPRPTRLGYCSYCWSVLKTATLCGDCLVPITDCNHGQELNR